MTVDYELGPEFFGKQTKDVVLKDGKLTLKSSMNKSGFLRCKVTAKVDGLTYEGMHIQPDFVSNQNVIRYTHRTTQTEEIYFVSNRTDKNILTECTFRISNKVPELWNPMNGEIYRLTKYTTSNNVTTIPLQFEGNEAYFIVFKQKQKTTPDIKKFNYSSYATLDTLKGACNGQ